MTKHNPLYVLRNSTAQHVIDAAEKGDYTLLKIVHEVLENPFVERNDCEWLFEVQQNEVCVSCSS